MDKGVGKHQKVSQSAFKTEIRVKGGFSDFGGFLGGIATGLRGSALSLHFRQGLGERLVSGLQGISGDFRRINGGGGLPLRFQKSQPHNAILYRTMPAVAAVTRTKMALNNT